MSKIIAQGAEATITLEKDIVKKNRIPKSYRFPALDEQLRKRRTKSEAKILEKLHGKINVPKLIRQDKFDLEIEFINGEKLAESLNSYPEKKQFEILHLLGGQVGKMHDLGIIHGDLTTSNVILMNNEKIEPSKHQIINQKGVIRRPSNTSEALYLIDFGLSFHSERLEDKAVDLHLIKQALEAKHYQNHEKLFKEFLKKYKPKDKTLVLKQLKEVESRGRYKH